jgi:phosphoglycolate phosphatase
VKPAAEHLAATPRPRIVYTDLDGTLLGPGASLFAGPAGGVTGLAAQAVEALHREGIALVPVSGRTEAQVREAARLLGADGYIAELGGITVRGQELIRTYGEYRGRGTPYRAMVRSGAAALLLQDRAGRLEPHAPWAHQGRECTMLFRGLLDLDRANQLLARSGHRWLALHDNGVIRRTFPGLDVPEVHAYHLVPRGVDKASAVAADLAARGLQARDALAVGDSASDAALAPHVTAVFLVANHAEVPVSMENVFVTDGSNGEGFAEVVFSLLG